MTVMTVFTLHFVKSIYRITGSLPCPRSITRTLNPSQIRINHTFLIPKFSLLSKSKAWQKVFLAMVLFCLVFGTLSAQESEGQEQEQQEAQAREQQQEQQEAQAREQQAQESEQQEAQEQQAQARESEQQEAQEPEQQEAQAQEREQQQEQEQQEAQAQEQEQQEAQAQEQEQQEAQEQEQEQQEQEQQEAQAREQQQAQEQQEVQGRQAQEREQEAQGQEREQKESAFTLSAGAGMFIGGEIGGGVSTDTDSVFVKLPYIGAGGMLFFDATYGEISFGIFGGGGTLISFVNLNIGLLGRYPFVINDKLSVFPLLGIDYQITVSAKKDGNEVKYSTITNRPDDNGKIAGDLSALWIKFGGGLDYGITEKIYARAEALYGIRIANKFESTTKTFFDNEGYSARILFGHGLIVKLAVGYKF